MSAQRSIDRLLTPYSIGKLKIGNRMVLSAFNTFSGTNDGYTAEETASYYEEAAKGGLGMLVTESTAIDYPQGLSGTPRTLINDDKQTDL